MSNLYYALKNKHEKEFNAFPIGFAFSEKQFEEAMEKLGLTKEDTDKIYKIPGGGFIRKSDSKALSEMIKRHEEEIEAAIDADLTGEGFVFDMFNYELGNHEYSYTLELEPALDALGLTLEDVNESAVLKRGLNKARIAQLEFVAN